MTHFGNYNRYYDGGGDKPFDPYNITKEERNEFKKMGLKTDYDIIQWYKAANDVLHPSQRGNATLKQLQTANNTFESLYKKPYRGAYEGGGPNNLTDRYLDLLKNVHVYGDGKVEGFEDLTPEQLDAYLFDTYATPEERGAKREAWYDTNIPILNKLAAQKDWEALNQYLTRPYIEGDTGPNALQPFGDSTIYNDPSTGSKYELITTQKDPNGPISFIAGHNASNFGFQPGYMYDKYGNPIYETKDADGNEIKNIRHRPMKVNPAFGRRANGNPQKELFNPISTPAGNFQINDPNQARPYGGGGRTSRRLYAAGGSMGMIPMGEQEDYNMVGAGGSHEQNPMGGVPYGMNADGSQNMVEQGETSVGNQVYSDRSSLSPELCQQLGLPEGTSPSQAMQQIEALYEQGQISDEEYQEIQNIIFQDQEMQKQNSGASYQQGGVGGPGVPQNEGIQPDMVGAGGQQFAYGGFRGFRF